MAQRSDEHGKPRRRRSPPFREATWHQQQISDDNWLLHFSCKAV
jgi:hypothetical protein